MHSIDIVVPCYGIGNRARFIVRSLLAQSFPENSSLRIVLVDDGSPADAAIPTDIANEAVEVVRHTANRGRAAARNSGAGATSGDLIWFIDADCTPESHLTLQAHLEAMDDHDGSVGAVRTCGTDFWSRYQNRNADDRLRRMNLGFDVNACTSANFFIRRAAFEKAGGFDERYSKYGFEDRDLFLRLVENGCRMGFSEQAVVTHDANLDLASVCRKMVTAGRYSSGVFRAAHPSAYRCTKYGKLDARDHGRMYGVMISIVWSALRSVRKLGDSFLKVRAVPFAMRAATASGFSAIAFAYGTLQAQEDASPS